MQLFLRSLRPPKEDQWVYLQYECHQEIWEASAKVNNYFLLLATHYFTISSSKPGVFRPVTFGKHYVYQQYPSSKAFMLLMCCLFIFTVCMVKWKSLFKSKIFLFQNFTFCFYEWKDFRIASNDNFWAIACPKKRYIIVDWNLNKSTDE